jgi:GTP-binding protein HflX
VGFIRNLPHDLVAAFRATLEEVNEADFLIHVIDASHPQAEMQADAVQEVLDELGAGGKPTVTVFNKSDLVEDQYHLREVVLRTPNSCYISAQSADGIPNLIERIVATLRSLLVSVTMHLPYDRSELVARCYEYGRVTQVDYRADGIYVEADITRDLAGRLAEFRTDMDR